MMTNNNEEIINEVSGNYNNEYNSEIISGNSDIVENGVPKGDMLNNSDDESIELVGGSERVIIGIDVLEREYEESLSRNMGQRVNCEIMVSHVFREDECSSIGDERSQNGPLSFCSVPGKRRRCFYNVVVPSAWSERENGKWEWEGDFVKKREVVLFDINPYKELVGILDMES